MPHIFTHWQHLSELGSTFRELLLVCRESSCDVSEHFRFHPVSFLLHLNIYLIPWPYFHLPLLCGTSWFCISSAGWSRDKICPRTVALVWSYECELCVLYRMTYCTLTTQTTLTPCSPPLDRRIIATVGEKGIKGERKVRQKDKEKTIQL